MKALPAVIVLAVLAGPLSEARAHFGPPDNIDTEWDAWAARQFSKAGRHCCAYSHARLYKAEYRHNSDGSVTLWFDGIEVNVPKEKLVNVMPDDQNPTGNAVVWYDDPVSALYCFTPPGTLT
jgi:hypothetical protein